MLQYKLIKKIKDDRFEEDRINQYYLYVSTGTRDFQIAVIDPADNRILLLEDYVFPSLSSHDELLQILEQLFDAHPFLKAAFWKMVKISIKNNKFVQVPAVLFVEEAAADYLRYNSPLNPGDDEVLHVENRATPATTVFAVQKGLKQWLTGLYPNTQVLFIHQSSALIEGVSRFAEKSQRENDLYIYIDRFRLHILAMDGTKLLYYNQFTIKQFSDYIRYIMLVMKSLNRRQESTRVVLWGYIGKNSPHYHEFYKYISNVAFGQRPAYLKFGYMFDEVQEHHFLDLYSMHLLGNDLARSAR